MLPGCVHTALLAPGWISLRSFDVDTSSVVFAAIFTRDKLLLICRSWVRVPARSPLPRRPVRDPNAEAGFATALRWPGRARNSRAQASRRRRRTGCRTSRRRSAASTKRPQGSFRLSHPFERRRRLSFKGEAYHVPPASACILCRLSVGIRARVSSIGPRARPVGPAGTRGVRYRPGYRRRPGRRRACDRRSCPHRRRRRMG